ncbi:MAG TPA: geranylgeranylglycerol-phosphate geranylgeranyltransferase [Ignavibacteriales bacterium]|nr:geranylgeranylglycerol-phosphate geranylgeranyltransferase [Ignavibacteriales bacterium]
MLNYLIDFFELSARIFIIKPFFYFQISRPVNLLISFLSVLAAGAISVQGEFPFYTAFYAALAAVFVAAAGNIINDIYDIEIDKINRPERILPQNKLTVKEALTAYFAFNAAAIVLASFVNLYALAIVILSCGIVLAYSAYLKKIPLLGNLVVAFMTGLAFIYGAISVGDWKYGLIPAVFAFVINLIREIIKDIEDIKGDKAQGIITFPQKYGINNAVYFATGLSVFLIILTTLPFILHLYRIEYFIIVMVAVNVTLVSFIKDINEADVLPGLRRSSLKLKTAMIFGLIAIYMGK